jgi:hypothetical protein
MRPPADLAARQRFIVTTGGTTVLLTLAFATALHLWVVPPLHGPVDAAARILLAARCLGVAVLPLLVAVFIVMRTRLWGGAHNPLLGEEEERLRIHIRVLHNTLEQFVLFAAGVFACAASVPAEHLHILPIATGLFVLGRAVFWWGYLRPGFVIARAPGVAVTIAVTFPLVIVGAAFSLRALVGGG